MKYIIFILIILIYFSGCKHLDMIFHPNDFEKRDTKRKYDFKIDTVYITTNQDGGIINTEKGYSQTNYYTFSKPGDSHTFRSGETIAIVYDNVDLSVMGFDIITDENSMTLKLVDKDFTKILIREKCKTISRTGIDYIPKIEVVQNLKNEKIYITPIIDDRNNRIGFTVRCGECTTNNGWQGLDPCRIKKKLGIPCP